MRNLRRIYAVAIAVAMLVTMMIPATVAAADYSEEATKLNKLGLYNGISETTFNPDLGSTLNRQTAATMLLRIFGLENEAKALSDAEALAIVKAKFTDASEIDTWALKHVAYAVNEEIVNGYPDKTFKPKKELTGREYATLLLKSSGYTGFKFEEAGSKFAEVAKLTSGEATEFGAASSIKKSVLVGASWKALNVKQNGGSGSTLIETLVSEKVVTEAAAKDTGAWTPAPATSPTAAPTVAPTSVPGATYGTVNVKVDLVAAQSIAQSQALFEFGEVSFEAVEDTTIDGIKFTRSGLSKDTDIASISVWDGPTRLNTPIVLSNNVADLSFTNPLVVKKGESKVLSLRLNVSATATSAAQVVLSIASKADVKTKGSVNGAFPYSSGALTISTVTLGQLNLTMAGDAPVEGLDVDVAKEVRFAKVKLTNVNEGVKLNRVIFTQAGSIADSDVANLKLVKDGVTVATVASLANRKAVFELSTPIVISLGSTVFLELKGDIVSGASRTIKFGIDNVNDIQATGETYGTTIVSDVTLEGRTLDIVEGTLLASKDDSAPKAGQIGSTVNDQVFNAIKLQATGEAVTVTKIKVLAQVTGAGAAVADFTDLKLWNGTSIVAQVQNPFASSATADVTLSSPVTINPGTPVVLKFSADLTNVAADETFKLGTANNASGITFTTKVSGKVDKVVNPSQIDGDTMTVGSVAVTAAFVPFPLKYAFNKGESNVKLGEFRLNHNLTETVNVSNLHLDFAFTGSAVIGDIRNLKVTNSAGTVLTDIVATPADPQTLTFKDSLAIKQGEYLTVQVVGDIATTSHAGNIQVGLSSGGAAGSATTLANGTSVDFAALAASGASITNLSVGGASFNVTRSAGQDVASTNVFRGQKDVKFAGYRFESDASGIEAATVNTIRLKPVATGTAAAEVNTITFGGDATGNGTISITLNGRTYQPLSYVDATDYDSSSVASSANDIAAFVASQSDKFVGYTVTRTPATNQVVFTSLKNGEKTNATVTSTITGITAGTDFTVAETTAGVTGALGNAYVENIRIVKAGNNSEVLANIGTLTAATEVILSKTFDVPEYSALSSYEIAVIGDIKADAPANNKYAIRLGDGDVTTTDVEYSNKTTGGTLTKKTEDIVAGAGTDAVFTTGLARLSVVNKPLANLSPANGAGAEIGRFTITNNGTQSIALESVELDDLNTTTGLGGSATASITLYERHNVLNTTAVTFDGATEFIVFDTRVLLDPGASKDIIVKLTSKGSIADGTAVNLQVVRQGTFHDTAENEGWLLPTNDRPVLDTVNLTAP